VNKGKENTTAQPFVLTLQSQESEDSVPGLLEQAELRCGDLCPACREAELDYDGLLNLSCANCGFVVGGCFT